MSVSIKTMKKMLRRLDSLMIEVRKNRCVLLTQQVDRKQLATIATRPFAKKFRQTWGLDC